MIRKPTVLPGEVSMVLPGQTMTVLPGGILTGFESTVVASPRMIPSGYADDYVPYRTDYHPPTSSSSLSSSSLLGFLRQDVEQVVAEDVPSYSFDGDYYQRRLNSRVEYSSVESGECLRCYGGDERTLSGSSESTPVTGSVTPSSVVAYGIETVSSCDQSNADARKFYVTNSNDVQPHPNDEAVSRSVDFEEVAINDQLLVDAGVDLTRSDADRRGSGAPFEPVDGPNSILGESETKASAGQVPSDVCGLLLAVVVTKNSTVDCSLPTID